MLATNKDTQLTEKQESAAQEFVRNGGNKSDAYRHAYNCTRMKEASVNRKAHELFSNVNVTARVEQLRAQAFERNRVTLDDLINTLADAAMFDISELYDEQGELLPLHKIPKRARLMITDLETVEISQGKGENRKAIGKTRKVVTIKKLGAVDMLVKILGGYSKDNAQKAQQAPPAPLFNDNPLTSDAQIDD